MRARGANQDHEYSVDKISKALLVDIIDSLQKVKSYGSVEIYVQDGVVTQITTRNIKKTPKHIVSK